MNTDVGWVGVLYALRKRMRLPAARTPSNVLEWRLMIVGGVQLILGLAHSTSRGNDSALGRAITTWASLALLLLNVALAIKSSRDIAGEFAEAREAMRQMLGKRDDGAVEGAGGKDQCDVVVTDVSPAPIGESGSETGERAPRRGERGGARVHPVDESGAGAAMGLNASAASDDPAIVERIERAQAARPHRDGGEERRHHSSERHHHHHHSEHHRHDSKEHHHSKHPEHHPSNHHSKEHHHHHSKEHHSSNHHSKHHHHRDHHAKGHHHHSEHAKRVRPSEGNV